MLPCYLVNVYVQWEQYTLPWVGGVNNAKSHVKRGFLHTPLVSLVRAFDEGKGLPGLSRTASAADAVGVILIRRWEVVVNDV